MSPREGVKIEKCGGHWTQKIVIVYKTIFNM